MIAITTSDSISVKVQRECMGELLEGVLKASQGRAVESI
jgi:hypothetical protein